MAMPKARPAIVTCTPPEYNEKSELYTFRGVVQHLSGSIDFTSLSRIIRAIKVGFRRTNERCKLVFYLDGTEGNDELRFKLSLSALREVEEIQELLRVQLNQWRGIS